MSLVPIDALIRPVEGHDELVAFRMDFVPEAKSLDSPVVTEVEDGDLIIEGYAAVFEGIDREGENFADGAFQRGIKAFLAGQAGVCYHHKHDKLLGKVLDLQQEAGKGLKMRARIDGAIRKHPELGTYYEQIKKGSLNALSVGGFFKRANVGGSPRIVDVDFTEISVTPVPIHPGTKFAVIAGKALEGTTLEAPEAAAEAPDATDEVDLADVLAKINALTEAFGKLSEKTTPAT